MERRVHLSSEGRNPSAVGERRSDYVRRKAADVMNHGRKAPRQLPSGTIEGPSAGRDIYFLGAGASYVHGAPLTNQILPYALNQMGVRDGRLRRVREFLSKVFSLHPEQKEDDYPSLVDVLSVVDMALDRRENLARAYDLDHLREVRRSLDYAIFKALDHSLGPTMDRKRPRSKATSRLVKELNPSTSVIISLNYDVIIDIALNLQFSNNNARPRRPSEGDELGIDYGLEFANIDHQRLGPQPFKLLKLHGSFNWLWSRVTGNVYFGGFDKSVRLIFDRRVRALDLKNYYERNPYTLFDEPTRDLEPILITPTHLKDMRNVHLAMLWRKAEQLLRDARKVTFIGYSLPSDDLHVKFLLNRAFETRKHDKHPSIVVVDFARGRKRTQVQENYERFFGRNVTYYRHGFDKYVTDYM